ncbi:hypothetical protein GGR50DRAFT_396552 [Xylaria sp. CBS 124048]|nr:hypothetical protein GGR50DRAFT_396552 [Xylaria sp. CBS 124048]
MTMNDWTAYEPPEGLRYTGDIESDVVARIVRESIDNVRARIVEEAKKAARRRESSETPDQECEDSEQLEVSENTRKRNSARAVKCGEPATSERDNAKASTSRYPTELPERPRRRTLRNLFHKANSGPENGESSAGGAARNRRPMNSAQVEPTTHSGRKGFILDLVKKAVGRDTKMGLAVFKKGKGSGIECASCLEDFKPPNIVNVPCHDYCRACFRRLISIACKYKENWPPKCCSNEIPYKTITLNVGRQQKLAYKARVTEWSRPWVDRMYCAEPRCTLFIQPASIIYTEGVAKCAKGHYTCILCRNARHEGGDCVQNPDMMQNNQLAEELGWRRCYRCQLYVEHRESCHHISCRCGAHFCYICGARWRTCRCSNGQLTAIKAQPRIHRQRRLDGEAMETIEAVEIRQAIRLVETFKREALKAELLHRNEPAARLQHEDDRRQAIALRFRELRSAFSELREIQLNMVHETQDRRREELRLKSEEAFQRLRENHELERMLERDKIEENILRYEGMLRSKLVARAIEERKIEERWATNLHAFWDGKEGGDQKIQPVMRSVRLRMESKATASRELAEKELDAYRHQLQGDQTIRERLRNDKELRLTDKMHEHAVEISWRNDAELQWAQQIFEERGRLLNGLKTAIENGEDVDIGFANASGDETQF